MIASSDGPGPQPRGLPAPGTYGTIVVVGGGCYGSYYVRQLGRAHRAGALQWRHLLVVDRDPACRVARECAAGTPTAPSLEIIESDWAGFFADHLDAAADAPTDSLDDAIVPSPLMPHLMFEWLAHRARQRWPSREVALEPLDQPPAVPWERAGADGTHYVSFATWECPINCIEPARCPATRGPRDWSMPPAMESFARAQRSRGRDLAGPAIFHCTHRAYGVGMFDVGEVVAGDEIVRQAGEGREARVLIGTVSHCHGALGVLHVSGPVPEESHALDYPATSKAPQGSRRTDRSEA